MAKVSVTVTYPGKLVDEHEEGHFYYKVTPRIRMGRMTLSDKERKEVINEVIREIRGKIKGLK